MPQDKVDSLMAKESVQVMLASNSGIRKAEGATGTRLEDMSLEEQAVAIGRKGVVHLESGGKAVAETPVQIHDGLMRKVVGGAADVLEYANDSVSKLVDLMGGDHLVGGLPRVQSFDQYAVPVVRHATPDGVLQVRRNRWVVTRRLSH